MSGAPPRSRLLAGLRAVAVEAVGIVADDWQLPLCLLAVLAAGWWLVAGVGLPGAGPLVAAALALTVLATTALAAGRRGRR